MRKFLNWIPNKIKGIYIVWFLINFVGLVLTRESFSYKEALFPFNPRSSYSDWGYTVRNVSNTFSSYDYSEFIIYTVVPILITLAVYFFIKDKKEKNK